MSGDHYLHHASTIIHLPGYLASKGIDPAPVFRSAGIPISTLLEPDGWFTRDSALAVASAAERLTGDQFIGVRQATKYRLEHLGIWGQTIVASPDLRSALRFACASVTMLENGTRMLVERSGGKARFHFQFIGRMGASPRQHVEASLLVLSKIIQLTGSDDVALRSSRESDQGAGELEAFFGSSLGFGLDSDSLEFDAELLDVRTDHAVSLEAAGHLETVRLLRDMIGTTLPYGRPTIERIAHQMGISVRTLQRRLRDFGTTFEALLDDIRCERALSLLGLGGASVIETAFVLGYSDVAHFTRAFRRWTGMAPRQYRSLARNEGAKLE